MTKKQAMQTRFIKAEKPMQNVAVGLTCPVMLAQLPIFLYYFNLKIKLLFFFIMLTVLITFANKFIISQR